LLARALNAANIISFSILCTIGYGVLHDQITARLCLEYFTVAHPKIEGLSDASTIALFWGVAATWLFGAFFGTLLAIAANIGKRPAYPFFLLIRSILVLFLTMSLCALVSGVIGYVLTAHRVIAPPSELLNLIAEPKHAMFMADAFAHEASYIVGIVGSLVVVETTWHMREKMHSSVLEANLSEINIRSAAISLSVELVVWFVLFFLGPLEIPISLDVTAGQFIHDRTKFGCFRVYIVYPPNFFNGQNAKGEVR